MLYHIQKILKETYQEKLMEVPSVIEWSDTIQDSHEWSDALSVRCKDEKNPENTPENMRKTHKLKRAKNQARSFRRPMGLIETKYGLMTYPAYSHISALIDKMAKEAEEKKKETPVSAEPPREPNKLEEIRRKLRGQ